MSQTKIKNKNQNQNIHTSVLLEEVMQYLAPKIGERYLDVTAGYGGHASRILDVTRSGAVLIDRDPNAVQELNTVFAGHKGVEVVNSDFLSAATELVDRKEQFDLILADLGVSSPHLDNASRGFSLQADGPLDMRMDTSQELTAEHIVNTYEAADLERILREYGEEPKARRMAELIVASRPLKSTSELAQVARKVWTHSSRVHPATRLFQAIRIAVNSELEQLQSVLPLLVRLLRTEGRVAIITFHSLEDRIVKRFLKEHAQDAYDAELELLSVKPVVATQQEQAINRRARSAKMRVAKRK